MDIVTFGFEVGKTGALLSGEREKGSTELYIALPVNVGQGSTKIDPIAGSTIQELGESLRVLINIKAAGIIDYSWEIFDRKTDIGDLKVNRLTPGEKNQLLDVLTLGHQN